MLSGGGRKKWFQVAQCSDISESSTGMFQASKVRKRTKIRNRYNQAPHLAQNTNGKVTTSQLDITNEIQEASPLPAGDHKAAMNRREVMTNTRQKYK